MRLRNAVLAGRIPGVPFFGAKLASASYAPFKLRRDLVSGLFFKRICATTGQGKICDRHQDRPGLHPLILETKHRIANCRFQIANVVIVPTAI
jgi:hypothetical protein